MKLDHANLCTSDVEALADVFARHFAFAVEQAGPDVALLRGSDGFFLVLMRTAGGAPRTYPWSDVGVPGQASTHFHVGFTVATPDAVRAKHRELAEAGRDPGPIKTFDALGATWTSFYCPVGDGIDIEVTAHG